MATATTSAPTSLAAHMSSLKHIKSIRDPEERNTAIGKTAAELSAKYLRQRQGSPAEQLRVIGILSKLAEFQPGCFGYGERARTDPILLAVLPLLAEPSAEWQDAVLQLLRLLLGLLHLSEAGACAGALRDAAQLLAGLPSPHADAVPAKIQAFGTLTGSAVELRLGSVGRLTWLESGLLQLCAETHASSPHLLGGSAAALLWTTVLRRLDHELDDTASLSRPVAVGALCALLRTHEPPTALYTLLLHRLLTLLCVRAEQAPRADSQPDEARCDDGDATQADYDDRLGECLRALTPRVLPPYPALRLLLRAVPWALCSSRSASLQQALSGLLCALPALVLERQLHPLVHLLGMRGSRALLHPCFERALLATPSRPTSAADATVAAVGMCSQPSTITLGNQDLATAPPLRPAPAAEPSDGGAPQAKRQRRPGTAEADASLVMLGSVYAQLSSVDAMAVEDGASASADGATSLQQFLMARAVALLPAEPDALQQQRPSLDDAAMADVDDAAASSEHDGRLRQQAAQLQALGAIVSIFARVARARMELGGAGPEAQVPASLLSKALAWLRALVVMAQRDDERTASAAAAADPPPDGANWMESLLHAGFDLVEDLAALDAQSLGQESALLSSEFADTAARLASLPWAATPAEDAAARYSVALRCQAVRVLAVLPPTSALPTLKRAMKGALVGLSQVDDAAQCADGNGGEESLAAATLEALPPLLRRLGRGHASAFAEFGGPSGELHALANCMLAAMQPAPAAGASTGMGASGARAAPALRLCEPLATTIGVLVCMHAGTCGDTPQNSLGALRCVVCEPSADMEDGGGGKIAPALPGAESGGGGWLQSWLPTLWKVQAALPTDDVAPRVALLRAMARLAQHAPLAMMMRARPVLTSLVRMLDDEQQDVAAACEQVLPRLLGRPEFVRALCHTIGESAPLCPTTLRNSVLRPMISQLTSHRERHRAASEPRATRRMLTMMRTITGLGCHPLYAAPECRGQVLLALCEHLTADELSVEYGAAMAQLSRLALTCARGAPGAPSGGTAACLAWLCRQLSAQLHPEWVWWLHEQPRLLAHVATKLLDTTEAELLHAAARHALPQLVLAAGTARQAAPTQSQPAGSATPRAAKLASILKGSPTQLLLDHMHLILIELFVSHGEAAAGDDDDGAAVKNGITFMYEMANEAFQQLTLPEMIKINCGELMQELVLRLGAAANQGGSAFGDVLRALNTLIPVAVTFIADDAEMEGNASQMPSGMLGSEGLSQGVNEANAVLRGFIQQNFFMLMQFLREKASHGLPCESAAAVRAIHEVLRLVKDGGALDASWWPELVATLKTLLEQETHRVPALRVMHTFVQQIHAEQLAHGMQQLVLMLLPCLRAHTKQVVAVLEAIVGREEADGERSDPLPRALGEISFLPDHPALARVHAKLRSHAPDFSLERQLRGCARLLAHESGAVRLMAVQQLLGDLRAASSAKLHGTLLSPHEKDRETTSELFNALLRACQRPGVSDPSRALLAEHASTVDLASQCLGELGAVDPSRLVVTQRRFLDDSNFLPGGAGDRRTQAPREEGGAGASEFTAQLTEVELSARIVERFLVRALQGAGEGAEVQATAYALMVLLQRVCNCSASTPGHVRAWKHHRDVLKRGSGDDSEWRKLRSEDKEGVRLWAGLTQKTQEAVKPYLTLSAELPPEAGPAEPEPSPIFRVGLSYSGWLTRWCHQLLQHVSKARVAGRFPRTATRAQLLLACKPCLRYNLGLARCLLPYMLQLLLMADGNKESLIALWRCELDAVLGAFAAAGIADEAAGSGAVGSGIGLAGGGGDDAALAEQLLCAQAIFEVLDVMFEWRTQHLRRSPSSTTAAAIHELLDAASRAQLVTAALRCGAPCRALLYAEQLADRECPHQARNVVGPGIKARELTPHVAALLYTAYRRTDEPDGLMRKVRDQSLEEEALEHERHGRYSSALGCYQVLQQQRLQRLQALVRPPVAAPTAGPAPASAEEAEEAPLLRFQLGLCRCLRHLGLFGQMKDSAEGALRQSHARGDAARLPLQSCALQAAWRLGHWDDVQLQRRDCMVDGGGAGGAGGAALGPDGGAAAEAAATATAAAAAGATADSSVGGGEAQFEAHLASALHALHRRDTRAVEACCSAARRALAPLLVAASTQAYVGATGAHAHVTKLQLLQELRATADVTSLARAPDDMLRALRELTAHWRRRLPLMAGAPQALEPVLAVRCGALRELLSQVGAPGCPADGLDADAHAGALLDEARRALSESWLRAAKSARAAGHRESATHALMQASLHDAASGALLGAKMDWEAAGRGETDQRAVTRLQQQLRTLRPAEGVRPPTEHGRQVLARTLLRLARYLEESGEGEPREVVAMYDEASRLCPEWEKAHFRLGHFHDSVLRKALASAMREEEASLVGKAAGNRSCPDKRRVPLVERQRKALEAYRQHLPGVLRHYGQALRRGGKHAPQALPRMLTLWLDGADLLSKQGQDANPTAATPIHETMHKLMSEVVPTAQWLAATPQLVSRICHRNPRAREIITQLLSRLLAEYPQQLVWSVVPAASSAVADRKRHGMQVLAAAKQRMMGANDTDYADLLSNGSRLVEQLKRVCNDPVGDQHKNDSCISMRSRWGHLFRLQGLRIVVPLHASLTVAANGERHAAEAGGGGGEAGGAGPLRPFAADAPTIDGWEDQVDIVKSLQRPKKIVMRGSDGQRYIFLCKPKDDLRKDARMMEFMTAVNRLLHKNPNCRRRQLAVQCYAVTPLDQECGLIEWVPNVMPIRNLVKQYWEMYQIHFDTRPVKAKHGEAMKVGRPGEQKRVDALARVIRELMVEFPPVLQLWLADTFRAPSQWFDARLAFTRSCGVMSMIGMAVGLGDRHLENILVNATTGSVMHVDFGCLFDHGLNLETPEKVPFRLTQNLLQTMGPCGGVDGVFRRVCELTLEQLRHHREALLNVLSTMRHDPLVEWAKRNTHEDASGRDDSVEANKELEKIDAKLRGVMEARGPGELSVSGQVQQLINEATDINNLCQMFIWWMPWC